MPLMVSNPCWLLLLGFVPLTLRLRGLRTAAVRYPTLATLRAVAPNSVRHRCTIIGLRVAALVLVVLALARPQAGRWIDELRRDDVMLVVDVSRSMLDDDVTIDERRVTRLDAVKLVVKEFVGARPEDRIGLMLFAARPYTQCPLTLDHSWLVENLERARVGMIEHGTAIGSAVAAALRHLRTSAAGSKFIIVLTDGSNNAGRITPLAAAEAAAALGVKVYTIGAGTPGAGPSFGQRIFGRVIPELEFDEETLQKMAAATGARYFRATDMPSLHAGFAEIDRYEKRSLVTRKFIAGRELYPWLLWPALGVLLLEIGLAETVLRKLP